MPEKLPWCPPCSIRLEAFHAWDGSMTARPSPTTTRKKSRARCRFRRASLRSEKPTLVSAMLYTAGGVPRMGRVDDGSAITDYDEEEIARKMSISTGIAFVEWGKPEAKVKINLLDTPGFNMFVHEADR